jgi:hypothetical protein
MADDLIGLANVLGTIISAIMQIYAQKPPAAAFQDKIEKM